MMKQATHRVVLRAASLLTGALFVAGLAGCDSIISSDTNASLTQKAKPTVSVSPVLGVPEKYAAKINTQLAEDVKAKGITIVDQKDADLVIKAAYAALPEAKKGTKLTYAIDVIDKTGNKVKRIEGDEVVSTKRGGEAWSHVNEEALTKVASRSTSELTSWIIDPNAPAPQAAPQAMAAASPAAGTSSAAASATKPVKAAAVKPADGPTLSSAVTPSAAKPAVTAALVPAVTGAPGDGKTSLAAAMKKALSEQGIKMASASGAGVYKIQGQVEMGAAANGSQPITIKWTVTDPSGKQMEKSIVQNNAVPAGQLDGAWGPIADQAAGAAAQEVAKLLSKPAVGQAQQATGRSAG
jgi:hypothetical protein